jgi:hypothetical protein
MRKSLVTLQHDFCRFAKSPPLAIYITDINPTAECRTNTRRCNPIELKTEAAQVSQLVLHTISDPKNLQLRPKKRVSQYFSLHL